MTSPFLLNIADLATPGDSRSEHITAPVDWSLELSSAEHDPPLEADLVVQAVTGGFLVRANVSVSFRHVCHRCLDEFVERHEVSASSMFMREPDDDSYLLTDAVIDVEQMLRDEVLLSLPMLPKCSDTCRGVVSTSGTGLNTAAAGDDADVSGSPFAVLRDLLDPGT